MISYFWIALLLVNPFLYSLNCMYSNVGKLDSVKAKTLIQINAQLISIFQSNKNLLLIDFNKYI